MSENPLVSVVTPAYNRAHFLPETIQSVLSQDYDNLEYIILDDGSTDDTQTVLSAITDPRVYWESHPNMGEVPTVNKAFSMTKGEYVVVLNSDDTLLPGYLKKCVDYMEQNPDVLMGYPRWAYLTADSVLIKEGLSFEYNRRAFLLEQRYIFGPGMILRRRALDLIPGRSTKYKYLHEIDYMFQLSLYSEKALGRIPFLLATWRFHDDNLQSEAKDAITEEKLKWAHDFYSRSDLPPDVKMLKRLALSNAYYNAWISYEFVFNKPIRARQMLLKSIFRAPFYRYYYRDGIPSPRTYISFLLFLPLKFIKKLFAWVKFRVYRPLAKRVNRLS